MKNKKAKKKNHLIEFSLIFHIFISSAISDDVKEYHYFVPGMLGPHARLAAHEAPWALNALEALLRRCAPITEVPTRRSRTVLLPARRGLLAAHAPPHSTHNTRVLLPPEARKALLDGL